MHYLEDLIEYLDDLPEELQDRLDQIRRWDVSTQELQAQCNEMQNTLFDPESTLSADEKIKIALEIAEKFNKMKRLSDKKNDLAERLCSLIGKLQKKSVENMEAFQSELAVDNPGVTQIIEDKFKRECEQKRHYDERITDDGTPFDSDESGRSTPDVLVPNIAESRSILKDYNNKSSKIRNGKGKPIAGKVEAIKRRGRKPGKDGVMSDYMRRKLAKEREQQKLIEIHAQRQKAMKKPEINSNMSNFDISAFCAQANGTNAPKQDVKKQEAKDFLSGDEDDEGLNIFAGLADMLGPDDQLRDDIDLSSNQFNLLSTLGRDDLELIESMNTGSLFSLDDDMMSGLGAASTSQSPMYSSFEGRSSTMNSTPSPIKPYPASFSDFDRKKKRNLMFSSVTDTSLHGRPRKLTDRAALLVQQSRKRAKRGRESSVGEEDSDNAIWCFCREKCYDKMIECDSSNCRYKWFHVGCVGLTEDFPDDPNTKWFCQDCRSLIHQPTEQH